MTDFSKPLVPKKILDKKYWQNVIGRYDFLINQENKKRTEALSILVNEIGQYTPDVLKNYISKHRVSPKKIKSTGIAKPKVMPKTP